jgi:hypothetical protein
VVFLGRWNSGETVVETDFLGRVTCETTASAFRAIVRGVPEGGCIEIGFGSILIPLLIFAAAVMVLQWIARRLVAAARGKTRPAAETCPVWSARDGRDGGSIR